MFTMRLMDKFDLLHQLVHVDTESGQLRRCECVDQIDPAYTREGGGLLVRDTPLGRPDKGCRQPHLAAKLLRRTVQSGERFVRHFDRDSCHGDHLVE